ncbi:hypothetical protein ACJZ2D_000394 [Fusarium nematophilum]
MWQQGHLGPAHEGAAQSPSDGSDKGTSRRGWRHLVLLIVSWNCLVVTFSSTSLLVATPEIAADLKTTSEILNVTNAGVLVAMGCSSMIWSPLAEIISRRHSYNAAIIVMLGASVGTAAAPNMAMFTAMRILSGLTGTYFMVAGHTIIADIFNPLVRGKAVGFMQVGSVAGTALGPCIGGVIITFSVWRSIYWLQVAMSALGFVLSITFIPSIKSEVRQLHGEVSRNDLSVIQVVKRFNPTKILKQFFRPQVFLADLTCGFLAVSQYGLLTSVRHIVNPRFQLKTPLISGLFYISPGMGFVVGSVIGGRMSDRAVKRYIAKRDGMRLPKDRLNSGLAHLLAILPISLLIYGWSLERKFGGLALPLVMAFWIGAGLMGAWNGLNTYTAGRYLVRIPSGELADQAKYMLQYLFGATSTATIIPLLNASGVGWTFTTSLKLLGGFLVLSVARIVPNAGVWEYKG